MLSILLLLKTVAINAQAPCEGDKVVFNTIFPNDSILTNDFYLLDGIRASNGEYVGIGVRSNANSVNACFFRLDQYGDLIGTTQIYGFETVTIPATANIQATDNGYHSLGQITEIFDAAGISQGYFLSMTKVGIYTAQDILVVRLNQSGSILASRVLEDEKFDSQSVDCIQRKDNQRMIVLANSYDTQGGSESKRFRLIEFDPITCNLTNHIQCYAGDFTDDYPFKIAQIATGPAPQFLVTSRIDSMGLKYIGTTVFSSNYSILAFGKGKIDIRPGISTETPYPTGLVYSNGKAYISGYSEYQNNGTKSEPFILQATLSPVGSNQLTVDWVNITPTSGFGNDGDRYYDLKLANDNNLLVAASKNGFNGGIVTSTILKFSPTGAFIWGRQLQSTVGSRTYARQQPTFIEPTPDGGCFYGASYQVSGNDPFRFYTMKTDENGWLHDCSCIAPYTPLFQSVVPPVLGLFPNVIIFFDSGLVPLSTAANIDLNQSFCNQFAPNPSNCDLLCQTNSVAINTGFDPITGTLGTPGQYTSFWTLCETPNSGITVPRPAYIVSPTVGWASQTQTAWLSAYPTANLNSNNPAPQTPYGFKNCFCVCDTSMVTFNLSALCDNNLSINLYTQSGTFLGNILNITSTTSTAFTTPTTAIKTFQLLPGNYCIKADLRNLSGVAMGFNIQGSVTGAGLLKSACCGGTNFITGQKYIDTNCDGTQNNGETGAQGWTFQLKNPATGAIIASAVSDNFGFYVFQDVPPGNYTVMEVQQSGYTITQPSSGMYAVTVNSAFDVIGGLNFGNCIAPCTPNFTYTQNPIDCYKINFTGTSTGTAPFTYAWDIGCNGSIDLTGTSPMFTFPTAVTVATYQVCLTVTDATGCTGTVTKTVTVQPDMVQPVLNCPVNITLNTNPGQCCATQNMSATATDNCSIPTITYILSGATTGINPNTCFNLGLTTIIATATDLSGNTATCVYTVTVRDQEKPVIICPANQTKSVPACQAGAIFTFNLPTVTDNCPLPTPTIVTCDRQSGAFFPCGTTIITCTATDAAGNTATCTFSVTVNCLCGEVAGADIECTSNPNVFTFQVLVQNQTGATGVCTLNVTPTQANIQISGLSTSWNGNLGTVSGTITVTDNCFPVNIFNVVQLQCPCPSGPVSCSLPFTLDVPCCHIISVNDAEICSKASQLLVPLSGCSALPDVQQVRWYVAYAPCPPIGDPAWGAPYQVTNGTVCHDLVLLPAYLTGDVCVYAEVQQGDCGGSCSLIYSNVANINLCAPITATITPKAYYCSTNVPSTVSFSVSYNPMGCTNSVEWFDQNNNSLGTNNTLNVAGLSFANAPIISSDACWREYEYRVVVNQPCGPKSYVTGIRIYDDNAGAGVLSLLAPDVNPPPFCPGEDAQIKYAPNCATKAPPATEPEWFWSISTVSAGGPYSPIPEAGNRNMLHVTNKQYVDTWYKVTKQNGVCPADEVSIFLDYYNQLVIGSFSVTKLDPCWSNGLVLTQNIVPITGCATTVKWYKNGDLIHTQVITGSVATYNYINAALGGNYEGNYYAVVEENCCNQVLKSNVVTVPPPCKVVVTGPCFRCLNEEMPLTGTIINPPTTGSCDYQWYILNDITNLYFLLSGQINATLNANMANTTYRFEANCDGCIKTVDFYIKQCIPVGTNEAEQNAAFLHIAPNPTNGMLTVTLAQEAPRGTWIDLVDITGRLIQTIRVADAALVQTLDLTHLSSGIYMIKLRLQDQVIGVAKVVKE
ncbi:MAG: hypothetical protein RIR11_550 [Bacteroidota bacterium]